MAISPDGCVLTIASPPGGYSVHWSTNAVKWHPLAYATVIAAPAIITEPATRPMCLYQSTPATPPRIIFIGDSLSTRPAFLARSIDEFVDLPPCWVRTNIAVWGKTLKSIVADAPENVWPFYDPAAHENVAVVWAGTNDLVTDSADAIHDRLRDFCLGLRERGWRVVVCPPMSNMIDEDKRLGLDALIRSTWPAWADGFSDFSADPRFGGRDAYLDNPLFIDWIHPNNYGVEILGRVLSAAVNAAARY
jgi:hypothetical protein